MCGEVIFLDQQYLQPAPGRIARDTRTINAAPDNEQIISGVIVGRIRHCRKFWRVQLALARENQ